MHLIAVGNPFDGMQLWGDEEGFPFQDTEEAIRVAECHFNRDDWCVVAVEPIADRKEFEDTSED